MAACLATGVGIAEAHTTTFPTEIDQMGATQTSMPGFYSYSTSGHLESQKRACLRERTIKLFLRAGGSKTLIDVGTSSQNGFWAVGGEATAEPEDILIKLSKERLASRPAHRHVCGADKLVVLPL